ncbi:Ig-like domain-containing protein, partial [Archangium sp.]|uniref:Ig-like domain-containing protein n=1 Tax=Archangium sp. TaxID=1872627 RepID=UPI002EDA1A0E
YKSFKLVTPSPSQYTSATLTVKNSNGAPIAGWTNKPISSADPTVDLSALSTALAGETPTFDVAAAGFTDTSVVPVAEFRVTPSSTPQLCWSLSVPEPTCPTTAGLASNATAGPRTTTVTAKGSIAQEAPAKPYTDQAMSATVNANPPDFTRCGGTLNATVGTGTGAPVAGLQVFLLDGAANPVLDGDGQPVSALSTASGGVSFPVWASTYKLKVSASARYTPTSMTVTAGGSGTTTASDGVVTSEAVSTTVGGTSSVTAVVDVLPPPPPSISSPASGARLGSATPVIRGTCLDGATVNVYADGSPLCTATCADDAFTCTSAILRDGAHTLYATQTDASATSTASAATSFSVDTAPPDTTLVTGPPSSTTSTSASFDFDSNEPGSSYECSLDDASFASCTDPVTFTDLSTGNHSLEVRARDAAGNEDPIPAAYDWRIEPVLAPSGLTFTTPANGSLLLDKSPTYSGTAGPGLEVLVKREDGVGVCTATADAAGAWSCVEPDTLVDGPHTRLAVSGSFLVAAGEPASTTFTVTTPVTPPAGGSDGGSGGSQDAGEPGAPPPSPEAGLSVYGRGCSSSGGSPLVWLMLLAVPLLRSRRSRPTARGSISSPSSR